MKLRSLVVGFSLLEVMVAMVVSVIGLTGVYQLLGSSTRSSNASDEMTRATSTARSLLSSFSYVPQEGILRSGVTADGLKWKVQSIPYLHAVNENFSIPVYSLKVEVNWKSGSVERKLELETLLLEELSWPLAGN